ncbi:MAG: peptidoglycan DD-metalloendopeptidase family protein [Acidimicrobiia bacterium]|nr:peptidoglycan DD-metalloendopeptidase family protein [Acidimicrobiia bacterium]
MIKRIALALAVVMIVTVPAYAQTGDVTQEDLAQAGENRKAASLQLADATADYESSLHQLLDIEADLSQLASALTARERELASTRAEARQVAQQMYMRSGVGQLDLFTAGSITEYRLGEGYLDRASSEEQSTLSRLVAVRQSYIDQQKVLDETLARQLTVTADLEQLAAQMLVVLEAADAEYRLVADQWAKQEAARIEAERKQREEEERRRREATSTTSSAPGTTAPPGGSTTTTIAPTTTTTLAPPPPVNGRTCPVNGAVAFRDSWGEPRSGGRSHQGVDMMAARGTPLVAIENGTVTRIGNGGLGGKTVWLRSDTGHEYYYAHLDGWASGLSEGDYLEVGELLGYVGNTGNAIHTLPHLHFEYHKNGGSAVNPYPLVADLCL